MKKIQPLHIFSLFLCTALSFLSCASTVYALPTYTITANASGDGEGEVASNDLSIHYDYPPTTTGVTGPIDESTNVTLAAYANPLNTLASWDDCEAQGGISSGNGTTYATCTFAALDDNKTLNATFTLSAPASKITVNASGDGTGSFEIYDNSNLITVSGPHSYPDTNTETSGWILNGTYVTVSAQDPTGMSIPAITDCEAQSGFYMFDSLFNQATCDFFSLDGDKTVNVTFTWNASKVTVNASGDGTGIFEIYDQTNGTTLSGPHSYPDTNTVTSDWVLNGNNVSVGAQDPTGMPIPAITDCEAQGGFYMFDSLFNQATCDFFSLDSDKTVNVTFTDNMFNLNLNTSGSGSGTVISTPAGIDCGTDCTEIYEHNTIVTLTPVAETGSSFVGWYGDDDCLDGEVTMTADLNCTASFAIDSYELLVILEGSGSGTVTSDPAGLDCGTDCTETYDYNTIITLTATPDQGSTFVGWSGDDDCLDGEVTITGDLNCAARFRRFPWNMYMPAITRAGY